MVSPAMRTSLTQIAVLGSGALARALGDGVATRIRVSREGGKDHIALELTGPPRPEPQVQDAFQRITRLRANAIRWTTTPSFDQPLEDTREF